MVPAQITRRTFVFGTAALSSLALSGTAVAENGARVVGETQINPRMLDITISSPALETNAPVRLLVPTGWTPGTTRVWPVLYLLHGAGDDYTSWTRSTDVAALTAQRNMLVVMPSGGRDGFYSDWRNHGAGGAPRWASFHLTEVVQILERGYGAGTSRAIAGLSMGGFGAMSYAARRPGMFRAAASYSGLLHTRQSARSISLIQGVLLKDGYDPYALWGDAALNADVWAAHNPYDLADKLLGIPLYVSCGNGQPGALDPSGALPDFAVEPVCLDQSVAFVHRIQQLGGTVTPHFYGAGLHSWPWWQRELHTSFPMLTRAIGA
ncbi:alpha/beta hydrolase [Kibdelosporangium aridum]|uniref:alpha/beta hydrolase n=1 Tax=Kibdelosporangium aridum TaxID=2030 RepID=UPI0005252283